MIYEKMNKILIHVAALNCVETEVPAVLATVVALQCLGTWVVRIL